MTLAHILSRCKRPVFYALTALMAYIAAERLAFVFPHLASGQALDLGSRYSAVRLWFGGAGLYEQSSSTYPPASQLLLWPLLGWASLETASRLWALLCALALGWLAVLCVRRETIASHSMRWFAAMTMLSLTATSSAIWLGQLIPLLLAALVGAMFLLHPPNGAKANGAQFGWQREWLAGALLLFALVKPSVTAPFLWLVLWSPARPRVAVGVLVGYGILTMAALWFQQDAAREVAVWAQTVNRNNAELSEGYANLRAWLAAIGLKPLSHPLALLALLWLGWWTFRHRDRDRLLLLSVTALVARLWTYHNLYDDLLLAIPMLLLLQVGARTGRIERGRIERGRAWQARALLLALILLLILPPDWMFAPSATGMAERGAFGLTLIATLIFLLRLANLAEFAQPQAAPSQPSQARPRA